MSSLPPVRLGAVIFICFIPGMVFRGMLQHRFVLSLPPIRRPARQFWLDFLLCAGAGLISALWIEWLVRFNMLIGHKILLGAIAAGFFIGLELALLRQREMILEPASFDTDAPTRLKPMTTRFILAAITASVLTALILGLVWAHDVNWLSEIGTDPAALKAAKQSVIIEIIFIISLVLAFFIRLIIVYSGNLGLLFQNQIQTLEAVSRGDFDKPAPVVTADEFGLIAMHTNQMIKGLSHRVQMQEAIRTAQEIQTNLLPQAPPGIPGLDIAAESRFCDETGGDYYDFIKLPQGRLGVAIGDVSGHGIGPALLMMSARASLRMAAQENKDPAWLITALNRRVCEDVRDGGRFLTLLFLELAPESKGICWVRAGHDPPLLFDPIREEFIELASEGFALPLGILPKAEYSITRCELWSPGEILVTATDGVWETRGPGRGMYGKERLKRIIMKNRSKTAREILDAIFLDLDEYRGPTPQEDDATLVLIKFT